MMKYIKRFLAWLKQLFKKKATEPKIPLWQKLQEDFKDKFEFGIYCGTAWYSFKNRQIPYWELKAMGIDYVIEQFGALPRLNAGLKEAAACGIKVIINGFYDVYKSGIASLKNILEDYPETFMGVLAYDEPHLEETNDQDTSCLSWVKENIIDKFRSIKIPGTCFINCLPNYARQSQVKDGSYNPEESYVDKETYYNYVSTTAVLSDVVCGDFYGPYTNKKQELWETYLNTTQEIAKLRNKPLWQFISCTKQGGSLAPTEEIIKERIYLNLLHGAQSLIFFKMLDYNSTDSPWTDKAEKSDTYDTIQKLLTQDVTLKQHLSLFKGAAVEHVLEEEGCYIVTLKKNGHTYKCYYPFANITRTLENRVWSDSVTEEPLEYTLTAGEMAVTYVP